MAARGDDPFYGIDVDMDPNDMPDSIEKYKTIVLRAREAGKGKWTDTVFTTDNALGRETESKLGGTNWVRASESEVHKQHGDRNGTVKIFEDGASAGDIIQGSLGDCYLLASMAVLGKRTNRLFKSVLPGELENEWKLTGCVCIEFWDGGKPDYIVIDDYLPVNRRGDFHMCDSPSKCEFWPHLIEKAYAKKYGSYNAIIGGLNQYALADMTGGLPDMRNHERINVNSDSYWKELMEASKTSFLGCGTP